MVGMKLVDHPDFEQAIVQASERYRDRRLRPALIEKDSYVTEALRVIATTSIQAISLRAYDAFIESEMPFLPAGG
jgi:hypothetical protein